jgi:iron complex transport system substrate-binding protein
MSHLFSKRLLVFLIGLFLILPAAAQNDAVVNANLNDTCATEYDPQVDYFPEKVEVTDAENFSVEYFNHYKVVTVTDAFDTAEPFTYVLVQCGTPAPAADDFDNAAQFIEVPAGDIIALQTTQLPKLTTLNLLDNLVGLDSFLYVNTPDIREMIANDELIAVGFGSNINVEVVLDINPDIVMTSGFNPDTDAHPVLIDAGIFTALDASWREPTPLARAEWIKYTALFYNAEAQAETAYSEIATAYEEVVQLAASVPADERPTVLWNRVFSDAWVIPGADTYAGRLIEDAGGRIALVEQAPADSVSLSFPVVYDAALDADVWIVNAFGVNTLDALLDEDPRYADFAAAQSGNVWNNSRDVNENGGNNYFELGVTNPHLILQDMIAIFHPDLLPDHEFLFFLPLELTDDE